MNGLPLTLFIWVFLIITINKSLGSPLFGSKVNQQHLKVNHDQGLMNLERTLRQNRPSGLANSMVIAMSSMLQSKDNHTDQHEDETLDKNEEVHESDTDAEESFAEAADGGGDTSVSTVSVPNTEKKVAEIGEDNDDDPGAIEIVDSATEGQSDGSDGHGHDHEDDPSHDHPNDDSKWKDSMGNATNSYPDTRNPKNQLLTIFLIPLIASLIIQPF